MRIQCHNLPNIFYYYAGLADKIEGHVPPIEKPDAFNYNCYEPFGVIACLIPWNSPLMISAWKIAPALAAGNTIVLKPSEYTSASLLELMHLANQAGFPPGVINVVTGLGPETGQALVTHPKIAKISFTGGEQTGKLIYAQAAQNLKPICLELGGKSPNIVFADAEFDNAVKGVISGIFAANGQTCIAGSRVLVEESLHDQFVEALMNFTRSSKMGDPMLADTNIGPIANEAQLNKVLNYIDIAKSEGAHCVLGGKQPELNGKHNWFVEPTIFTQVNNQMRIAQEEVFGPVLSIIPFKNINDAIQIANDTPYGLAAGVWTSDIRKALELPKQLHAGTVWVNTYRTMSYMSPFGGYKRSGFGRENGMAAIYEFLQSKTVWISTAQEVANPFVIR
jgi:aldehyde dehydrogenase (NAD+)